MKPPISINSFFSFFVITKIPGENISALDEDFAIFRAECEASRAAASGFDLDHLTRPRVEESFRRPLALLMDGPVEAGVAWVPAIEARVGRREVDPFLGVMESRDEFHVARLDRFGQLAQDVPLGAHLRRVPGRGPG